MWAKFVFTADDGLIYREDIPDDMVAGWRYAYRGPSPRRNWEVFVDAPDTFALRPTAANQWDQHQLVICVRLP